MAMPLIIKRGALRLLLQEELDYIFSQGLVFGSVSAYRCSVLTLRKMPKADAIGASLVEVGGWGPAAPS